MIIVVDASAVVVDRFGNLIDQITIAITNNHLLAAKQLTNGQRKFEESVWVPT